MFQKAERSQVKMKIAIDGPSGSGKTFSALRLARGMGSKVALIDSEKGRASLYSDVFPGFSFDTVRIEPPFTVDKYLAALKAAVAEKYDVLIVDSLSHAWMGTGGLLEQKEILDARGGSGWANWATIKAQYAELRDQLLESDIDLIVTMRSKQEHTQVEDDKGRKKVIKLGMAPEIAPGAEYEFAVVFDLAMNHSASLSKDNTHLFDGKILPVLDESIGRALVEWRNGGKPIVPGIAAPTVTVAAQPAPTPPTAVAPATNGSAPPQGDRPNQHAGACVNCGGQVAERAGVLAKKPDGKWGAAHRLGQCVAADAAADPNAPDPQNAEIEALIRQKALTVAMVKVQVARLGCAVDDQCDWRNIAVVDKVRLIDVLRSLPAQQPAVPA